MNENGRMHKGEMMGEKIAHFGVSGGNMGVEKMCSFLFRETL